MAVAVLRRDFEPAEIAAIGDELDRSGFACISDIVDPAWIDRARNQVDQARDGRDAGVFTILHPGKIAGSPTRELAENPQIKGLMKVLAEHAAPPAADDQEGAYTVLRVVGGGSPDKVVPLYHYDASTVTVLVPIYIPVGEEGLCGDLVVYPNKRKFRKWVLANIVEKVIVQSGRFNAYFHHRFLSGNRAELRKLCPGNIYLFWGYRSYHGNYGCAPDALRATLLLHYGNPHGASALLRAVRGYRIWRIKRAEHGDKKT